jgi:hypothetical protein
MIRLLPSQVGLVPLLDGGLAAAAVHEALVAGHLQALTETLHLLLATLAVKHLVLVLSHAGHTGAFAAHADARPVGGELVLILNGKHLLPLPGGHLQASLLHLDGLHVLSLLVLVDELDVHRLPVRLHHLELRSRVRAHVRQLLEALVRRGAVSLLHDLEYVFVAADLAVGHGVHGLDLARRASVLVVAVQAPVVAEVVIRLISVLVRVRRPPGES